MKQLSRKDIVVIGFMLFALFFGAGNLIFPPFLGQEAGHQFWVAIIGFIITGVGLPIIAIIAISSVKGGVRAITDRVHPIFGLVFTIILYLMIGPFMGIPRGANVAFEMGISPFLPSLTKGALIIFSVFFFTLVYVLSLNPSKLVDRIGIVLTPFLLGAIALIGVGGILNLEFPKVNAISSKYAQSPFFTGFMEGYLTMDTIGALAFGIVIITSIKSKGMTSQKEIVQTTAKAGIIAGIGLAVVYVVIGLIGVKMTSVGTFENGGDILTNAANQLYGTPGMILLGLTVAVACFTTCVGLVTACSQYFLTLWPTISYKYMTLLLTLLSALIANIGLNEIISLSIPVLTVIYPLTIVLIVLTFLHSLFGGSSIVYISALIGTGLVSIYDGLKEIGIVQGAQLLHYLPLYESGLGWSLPAVVGGAIGWILSRKSNTKGIKE
ncbi:branched-chain amino acid transport system II carrier protein [Bacillus sp. CGMCC 1.16541]|uniref:branched-chain amino acid transport system II carrier protein n=1 Tax=Bacillus sp. CGMCC 1.16541 TaxID=2185143 RepID=UPI000D7289E9|nr:branched-chain amino acid transport system II carrier protein [Bacillus sp. CGMCC 1.16541]